MREFFFQLRFLICLILVAVMLCVETGVAQMSAPEAMQFEVEKSERQIREVRVEIGNRYEKRLTELKSAYQKAADLENALIVRAEAQRVETEPNHPLEAHHIVEEPRLLKEAQMELLSKQTEMILQIVQMIVPKLVELKRTLTVSGKLDEAVEIRTTIQRLQEAASPAQRLPDNSLVSAEEVVQNYQTSRERGDKCYRGVRLTLRGKVVGIKPDPKDASVNILALFGGTEGAIVECSFSSPEYRVREEKMGQNLYYVVSRSNADPSAPTLRAQRGGVVEITGRCEGYEGAVRFGGCSYPKR
jgi:hypothetical protein